LTCRPRLVLVIWSLGPGGAERVLTTLANHWASTHDVEIVVLGRDHTDHYPLAPAVRRVDLSRPRRQATRRASRDDVVTAAPGLPAQRSFSRRLRDRVGDIVHHLLLAWKLRRHLVRTRPDAVVAFIDRTNIMTLTASRGLGVPVVVSERTDPREHASQLSGYDRVLRRLTYPWADAVVFQTQSAAQGGLPWLPVSRVRVVPNPVHACPAAPSTRRDLVVGMGRLSPEKGFDRLLNAFARVAPDHPTWRLCLLGEGPLRADLLEQARTLGVEERLAMPGVVADPEATLSAGKVFALTSRYEGFPNALLEAMACGMGVVAVDCRSGPAEIVTDGVDGLLVPQDDPDRLATALDRLLTDEHLRSRLGAKARSSVGRFEVEAVADQWLDILREARRQR